MMICIEVFNTTMYVAKIPLWYWASYWHQTGLIKSFVLLVLPCIWSGVVCNSYKLAHTLSRILAQCKACFITENKNAIDVHH